MKQRQREQVQRGCAVGTVVLLAWLCRVLPLEGMPSGLQEACGILRLCNRQMFRVYRALSGRDLQSLKELHQQVWAPAPETPVLPAVQDAKLIQTGTSGWLAGRPDAGRRHGAVCSGILDGAQAQGHVLQVPALNPNPQRPRANAPLTLWAMHHIP